MFLSWFALNWETGFHSQFKSYLTSIVRFECFMKHFAQVFKIGIKVMEFLFIECRRCECVFVYFTLMRSLSYIFSIGCGAQLFPKLLFRMACPSLFEMLLGYLNEFGPVGRIWWLISLDCRRKKSWAKPTIETARPV